MRSYIHLPYTPSGRLDPSFGHWRSCPLGASAWISGCWLLWNILVLACTWRFSWRIHSILGNKVLRCRNISVSHSLSQDWIRGSCFFHFSSLVDHPLWIVVVVEYFAEVIYSLARISGSEQTFSALSINALTTALLAETGWLELKSKYLSVWVGFL